MDVVETISITPTFWLEAESDINIVIINISHGAVGPWAVGACASVSAETPQHPIE